MRTWGVRVAAAAVGVLAASGLVGCADSGVTSSDAYRIGCPALDTVVGGGTLGSKAAVAGLEKLRDQSELGEQTTRWLDAAIVALSSTDPNEMPADAKALLTGGCADNGYPLRNLTT